VIPGLVLVLGPGLALNPGSRSPLYSAYGKESTACLKEVQYNTV
jgi:hypothetical protein